MQTRQPEPVGFAQSGHSFTVETTDDRGEDPADHDADQNAQPAEQPGTDDRDQQDRNERDRGDQRLRFEGTDRRRSEVETDQRDDGACHYRRHDGVDDPAADQTYGDADQHQHDADGHDGTELRGRARSCRRCQRGDEREGRTEIARDPAPGDEQEQRGADTREQQRRRDGEAGDGRNEQCRSEHRDDVLHPDSDGARPTQSFVRRHDGSVGDPLAVSVDSPADSAGPGHCFSFDHRSKY